MQFDNSFSIEAPIAEVFAVVADVERVVPCVPGAKLLERRGDTVFEVALKSRIGPVWKRFLGTITVVECDADAHRMVMTNRGRSPGGEHVGDARIEIALAELGAHTNVSIYSIVTIVDGTIAEKTVTEASAKQMAEFTVNLRELIEAR